MKKNKNSTRAFALKILYKILHKKIFFSDAIALYENNFDQFSDRDKKYIYQLVHTVLRKKGYIDKIINLYLEKPLKNPEIKLILKIGIAQIVFLRTPGYAAVNHTVEIIKPKLKPFKPLVNAILRKISDNENIYKDIIDNTIYILPDWILKRWQKNYGERTTKLITKSLTNEPYLDITINKNQNKIFREYNPTVLPNSSLRLKKFSKISSLPMYDQGRWWVQDASATFPANLLINKLHNLKKIGVILDTCAAPGGKTIQLLSAGFDVISIDHDIKRINIMKNNLIRMRLNHSIVSTNYLEWKPKSNNISGILVDAPCSGTGTLRRNPDIMWNREKHEILKLSNIQTKLLQHSLSLLQTGGILVYSVCSIEPEEGINIARKAMNWPNISVSKISADEMPKLEDSITKEGFAQILPHYWSDFGGLDGFFIARFEKK
ncbi:MAG: hypothetical protein CMM18_01710 [Rhodospirillaceae bacterium]|nr:hypothetical protein [Rhodospirillaceae bacterium]